MLNGVLRLLCHPASKKEVHLSSVNHTEKKDLSDSSEIRTLAPEGTRLAGERLRPLGQTAIRTQVNKVST